MKAVFAVAAVIIKGTKVLAMRRSLDRDAGAGLWETVSGRVEPEEQPLDAIVREITEETGLQVRVDKRPIDAYAARRAGAPMVVIVYRAEHVAGEVVRSAEHDEHMWCTPAEFRDRSTLTRLARAIDDAFAVTTGAASRGDRAGGRDVEG